MIDHIGYSARDYATSKAFYAAALAPLGLGVVMEGHGGTGFGRDGKPAFWLADQGPGGAQPHVHLAFTAQSREAVRAFHAAALAAGGTDNGAPGLRTQYHPHYYGAFVLDPDGHNIEAVCHKPEAD